MKLIVRPIENFVEQILTPTKENSMVGAVRPHLYIHNCPGVPLQVRILSLRGSLIAESDVIDTSEITAAPFYHGYVRFLIEANLKKGTKYRFQVAALSPYTFDSDSYVGVANDYDLRKYQPNPADPPSMLAPLDIEVWTFSKK